MNKLIDNQDTFVRQAAVDLAIRMAHGNGGSTTAKEVVSNAQEIYDFLMPKINERS